MQALFVFFQRVAGISYTACYFELSDLLCFSTFDQIQKNPFLVLEWSGQFFLWTSQIAALCATICLCLDLIITLRNPFSVAESRMQWYIAGSIVIPLLLVSVIFMNSDHQMPPAVIFIKDLTGQCEELSNCQSRDSEKYYTIIILLFQIYLLIAFFSVSYSTVRLLRPGVSEDQRRLFYRNHIYFVYWATVSWTIVLAPEIIELYESDHWKHESNSHSRILAAKKISTTFILLMGYGFTLRNMLEPYTKGVIKKRWQSFFGVVYESKEQEN